MKVVSKVVSQVLRRHDSLRRDYRSKRISNKKFDKELLRLIDGLGELTAIHGDSFPITSAKIEVWGTIELYVENYERVEVDDGEED